MRVLWGTANLFGARRFMAGAATNPDPDVFAYAAAQVKNAIDVTHRLGGANYVLWGGREGYETLLNTDLKRELAQLGRFLKMVVEYKHKIGFKGVILIEPKPQEPTKHQYDFDVATVFGFLKANRPRERGQGQHRGRPCGAGAPFVRARGLARRGAGRSRFGRRQPQRLPERLGHRPVPQQRARAVAGAARHSEGGRLAPAGSISTPGCAASRSSRSTSSMAISAASTRWRTR